MNKKKRSFTINKVLENHLLDILYNHSVKDLKNKKG